jgi:Raf kinase inhibitor-like YbhB/YbcL family protein
MAEHGPSPHAGEPLTIQAVAPATAGALVVRSPAVDADGYIDPIHAADGDNRSPALTWTAVLEAESFALVVEDPDAPGDAPFVHWLIWDIPGTAKDLAAGVPLGPGPEVPQGAVQGRNGMGQHGWFGPRPPVGHGVHRYHFQLFALGKRLGMGPDTPLSELLNALKGNTLASGELVGLFERRDPIGDAPSPARTGSYGTDASNSSASSQDMAAGRGGLDGDDPDRHAPHGPDGEVRRRSGDPERPAG